jgi:UDP-N-acetylglucosamine acyltransferase
LIDSRAVVDAAAEIADGVRIGPFSVIGPQVVIGSGTWIGPHAVINGPTRIGANNKIYQFASIGGDAQDRKYRGEPSRLEIGDGNVIREYVSINRGTGHGGGVTRLGDRNWIMASCHIAHDCQVGNDTTFANGASLAGHVRVEDHATLGGYTLVHQFCVIGAYAFTAFGSVISKDVPPFMTVAGNPARARGLNKEGLKRNAFPEAALQTLQQAYRTLYRSGASPDQQIEQLRQQAGQDTHVGLLVRFLEQHRRGIIH